MANVAWAQNFDTELIQLAETADAGHASTAHTMVMLMPDVQNEADEEKTKWFEGAVGVMTAPGSEKHQQYESTSLMALACVRLPQELGNMPVMLV